MDEHNPLILGLLVGLKEHERALLELEAKISHLDDRLEHLRLEGISISQATWMEMSNRSNEGRSLMRKLHQSASQIKHAGLHLLRQRLPDKAARLEKLGTILDSLGEMEFSESSLA